MQIIPAMKDALCFTLKVKKKANRSFVDICFWGSNLLDIDSPYFMRIRAKTKC